MASSTCGNVVAMSCVFVPVFVAALVTALARRLIDGVAAMALIQTFTVVLALIILFRVARGMTKELQ